MPRRTTRQKDRATAKRLARINRHPVTYGRKG